MSILKFTAQDHKYRSEYGADWLSVTSLISNFKQPFDADGIANKVAKSKKSKWYGMTPSEIKEAWKSEALRATTLGTWYHNQRESDICGFENMERHGVTIPIFKPVEIDGVKYSPEQKLKDGIYPEHMVYLRSAGICGQSDRVEVIKDTIDIVDYKTNKEIKKESFRNWEGISQKMTGPLVHLDDCNFNHYALQLSTYMYIILKHNPRYKSGKMALHHVIFEKDGEDKFGNPILRKDEKDQPVVKTVILYDVPYLKSEVISMIKYLQDNPDILK
jgi:hypothetical protein